MQSIYLTYHIPRLENLICCESDIPVLINDFFLCVKSSTCQMPPTCIQISFLVGMDHIPWFAISNNIWPPPPLLPLPPWRMDGAGGGCLPPSGGGSSPFLPQQSPQPTTGVVCLECTIHRIIGGIQNRRKHFYNSQGTVPSCALCMLLNTPSRDWSTGKYKATNRVYCLTICLTYT